MAVLLALDVGGTSARAVALEVSGRAATVLGTGRAGGGNPTAVGIEAAVGAIASAAETALAPSGRRTPTAVVAMAGEQKPAFVDALTARLAVAGVRGVALRPDLLALFHTGTWSDDGYALIAGTGSIAARVLGGEIVARAGGLGWLIGDDGSGFWVGRAVVRAATAALDGTGPATALVGPVLAALGVPEGQDVVPTLRGIVGAVYADRPVALSALAPLAFRHAADPVARAIVVEASEHLARLLAAVRVPSLDGPVVVGGSVVVRGFLDAPADLRAALVPLAGGRPVVPAADGLVGAAVLALRHAGVTVDEPLHRSLRSQLP